MQSEKQSPKAVVLLSGGLDSTTCLALAKSLGYQCYCLSFAYGQRQQVELECARKISSVFEVAEHLVLGLDLDKIGGSSLTADQEVPKGRELAEMQKTVPSTYVPGRNTIFLAHAAAWAEVIGARDIFIGANVMDYSGYPDCRPEFLEAFERVVNLGTKAGSQGDFFTVHAPLLKLTKKEIIEKGLGLGVDYSLTHSCYDPDGSGRACGGCDACRLRLKGFAGAGIADPVVYRVQAGEATTGRRNLPAGSFAVGRMVMIGLPGEALDASTRSLIVEHQVNNFILFKRNIADPDQLKSLCRDLRDECRRHNLPSPLISIDQEGGSVIRLPRPYTQFGHARDLGSDVAAEEKLAGFARITARELRDTGINCNLAPVLDICPEEEQYFMARRCLSADPERAGRLGGLVVNEFQTRGVAACGKHFPGLGRVLPDPHKVRPTIALSPAELARDLLPFAAAIDAGIAAIMTSHAVYPGYEKGVPATLSKIILTDILRLEMRFGGVVITDDLEMGAIENVESVADAAVAALLAGADLLLICHDHDKVRETLEKLTRLSRDVQHHRRFRLALRRIAAMQLRYKIH